MGGYNEKKTQVLSYDKTFVLSTLHTGGYLMEW
jgi:hypothetical protein